MITQIYAIQTVEDALACIEAGADYFGFLPPQGRPDGPRYDELTDEMTRTNAASPEGSGKAALRKDIEKVRAFCQAAKQA